MHQYAMDDVHGIRLFLTSHERCMSKIHGFVAITFVVLLISTCVPVYAEDKKIETAQEPMKAEYKVEKSVNVLLETFNGFVEVVRGDDPVVKVAVLKSAKADTGAEATKLLSSIKVDMNEDRGIVQIKATTDPKVRGQRSAAVRLTVPVSAGIDLTTSNGAITVSGLQGGELSATTKNGLISLSKCSDLRVLAKNANGDIELTSVLGLKKVQLDATNGDIQFDGSLGIDDHSMTTKNGQVSIRLPSDATFALVANTGNGSVEMGFALSTTKSMRQSKVDGTVGTKSKTQLHVSSGNGGISILKAKE
jgi:Putative adhesin